MKRSPLVRRTPLRSRPDPLSPTGGVKRTGGYRPRAWQRDEDDKVQPGLRWKVLNRDGRCMAPVLDPSLNTICRDIFGNVLTTGSYETLTKLQLDHVKDDLAMGNRAPSDEFHLISICPYHHLQGWATSKRGRNLEREYLQSLRSP